MNDNNNGINQQHYDHRDKPRRHGHKYHYSRKDEKLQLEQGQIPELETSYSSRRGYKAGDKPRKFKGYRKGDFKIVFGDDDQGEEFKDSQQSQENSHQDGQTFDILDLVPTRQKGRGFKFNKKYEEEKKNDEEMEQKKFAFKMKRKSRRASQREEQNAPLIIMEAGTHLIDNIELPDNDNFSVSDITKSRSDRKSVV